MKVTINGNEVDFEPEYPNGWEFSAGDPFKSPVVMGDSQCFIKRFEQKSPEDISGWGLLQSISGKDIKNLSKIYDIKKVEENENEIYYVFYEYLEGVTLDRYIQNADINLTHLTDDLYKALGSLQKHEYWFADFCEKNIFCQKDRTFTLVDVDSAQRITDLPENEMYGSKDYWILVFKFYKDILNINDIRLSDINGMSFNYLQVIFLVLRLKLFLKGQRKDYNSTELFNRLPSQLNETAPEVRDIFLNASTNGKQPVSQDQINKIADLINRRIIRNENIKDVVMAPAKLPAIKEFITNTYEVQSGGSFTLSWQVENATRMELYKNGAKLKDFDINQKELALTGFADGTRQQSSYQLIAYKDLAMAKSNSIIIKLKESGNASRKPLKGILIALGLLAFVAVSFLVLKNLFTKSIRLKIIEQEVYENSVITLYGKNLPDANAVHVFFNNIESEIESTSNDRLNIRVPNLGNIISGDRVEIAAISNNHTLFTRKYIISYDSLQLIDAASKAQWERGLVLPGENKITPATFALQGNWPGLESDKQGFANTGTFIMEDANTYNVLRTHPRWLPNGTIRGLFSLNLKGKKTFKAQCGFVKDVVSAAQSTDGVQFQVWAHYLINGIEKSKKIYDHHKDYDRMLVDISVDFPNDTPDDFKIELRVDAGNESNVDWAAWVDPVVISRKLTNPEK